MLSQFYVAVDVKRIENHPHKSYLDMKIKIDMFRHQIFLMRHIIVRKIWPQMGLIEVKRKAADRAFDHVFFC